MAQREQLFALQPDQLIARQEHLIMLERGQLTERQA